MIEKVVLNGEEHKLSPDYKDIRNKPSINGVELKEGDNKIEIIDINIDPDVDIVEEGETPSVINTGTSKNPTLKFSLPKGDKGDTGKVYIPSVDKESGDLSWSLQDNPQSIDSTNIKGPQGERGVGLNANFTKLGKVTTVNITTDETTPQILKTFQINDGNDGHNPCLGRLNVVPASFSAAFPNAIEGDYVYVDLYDDTTQTTITTIYHYALNDNTLEWDNGTVIDVENPTFATTQAVEAVAIKDIDGNNDLNAVGVLSAEAGKELKDDLYGTSVEQELDNIKSTLTDTSFGDFCLGKDSTKEWRYATSGTDGHRKNRHGALDSTWKKLKITANANYKTIYTFTKQLMPDRQITDANELSDYIIEGAYMKSVNVGETGIVDIPNNAKYIYFRSKIQSDETNGKYIPTSVIPLIETKEGGDVNNLSEQVLRIQNTITDIGNNVDALDETVLGTIEEVEENGLENPISVTPMNMNNDGYTINRATGRICYKISVEGAKRLYVKANDVKQAHFLLTTEELPTIGNITSSELYNTYVPHDCDGYNCSSTKAWMTLFSGQDVTIELSESAKYLYWQKNYGSTPDNTPQIITVTRDARVGGLVNEVSKRRDAFVISEELSFSFGTMNSDGQIKDSNNILISNPITLKNGYYLKLDESYRIYRIHTIDTTNGCIADFYCVPHFSNIETAASSNSYKVLRSGKAIAGVGIVFEVVRKDLSTPNKTDRIVDKFFTLADLLNLGYRQILPNLVVDGSPATEEQVREIYGNYLKRNNIVQRITWRALRPVFPPLNGSRSIRFKGGAELIGINYSETSEWSKYVPQHVSTRTYLTSLLNPRSVMYTEHIDSSDRASKYGFTHNSLSSKSGAYYGTVCTGLTSWLLGLDSLVIVSSKWGNSSWASKTMNLIGSNIAVGDGENKTSYESFLDEIQPMDFVWNSGHCWSIKAIYVNDDGERIYIVTEQNSYNVTATEYIYHKNELINRLRGNESDGGWKVLRKKDWAGYTPPSDIDMSAVTHNNIQYPNLKPFDIDPDITTFAGEYPVFVINGDNDNSESYNNYKAFLNVHRAQGKYSTLQIFSEDADEATEDPVATIDISNNQTYIYNSSEIIADDAQDKEDWVIIDLMNIPSPLTAGKYKARVVGSNDTSGFCHWQMVELSFVNNNGVLTFSADDGLTPSGAIPVLIRHESIVGMHSGYSDEWKEASELNSGTVTVNWAGEYAKLYVRTDYGVAVKRIML